MFKEIFIKRKFLTGFIIRLSIILITEPLLKMGIDYTDIDYHVISDGGNMILNGKSPYDRETYRYTPLLALLVTFNSFLNYNIGKIIFSVIDVYVAYIIEQLISENKLNSTNYNKNNNSVAKIKETKDYDNNLATLIYLYNPFTINICTRGSSDCIITLFVLLTLKYIRKESYLMAGFVYGLSVHFKIYPIIYAPALYMYIIHKSTKEQYQINQQPSILNEINNINNKLFLFFKHIIYTLYQMIKNIFNKKALKFAFISLSIFTALIALFYYMYGYQFLFEYLLYHLVRKDHRHNYSMFYYLIYLTYKSNFSKFLSLVTFVPQIALILTSTLVLYKDINLCLVIITMIFVTFNKVVTAQYFLWYISLIPLILPFNKLFKQRKGLILLILWFFFELIWNRYSHNLEYKGINLFVELWVIDVLFFLVNCFIISELIKNKI